jgi:hypothetical protein
MCKFRALLAPIFILAATFACGPQKTPPPGRWQGVYESRSEIILVRLEIEPGGAIYLSAPNVTDIDGASADDRGAIRQKLNSELETAWNGIEPRVLEFDGSVFRKPGGVAPQLEWDADTRRMAAIIYIGMKPGIRIPLQAVARFGK